jgi:hypothetical protein
MEVKWAASSVAVEETTIIHSLFIVQRTRHACSCNRVIRECREDIFIELFNINKYSCSEYWKCLFSVKLIC